MEENRICEYHADNHSCPVAELATVRLAALRNFSNEQQLSYLLAYTSYCPLCFHVKHFSLKLICLLLQPLNYG